MVHACSIIARNYLAHARVLASSFLAHHPQGTFTLLLVDDEERRFDESGEPFRCVRLGDIGLEAPQITRLAALYDVTELATAVKPRFLRHLLSSGFTDVIYLDPDIKLYGSLEKAARLAREHGIVLTPHMLAPFPKDGRHVNEFHILAAGVYNLGFIAVGARSEPFIAWWWGKTEREAYSDPARMMFTDQRWVDFVPSFFEHVILKDPGYNVAYWNLHERNLTWSGDGYLANGRPLTFFHFSGFDGRNPHLLSKHQGDRPRILLSQHPAVARICCEYRTSLEEAGLAIVSVLPYGWRTLPSGAPFDRRMRALYREGLEAFEAGRKPEPPNPFDPGDEERFVDWLGEPVAPRLRPTISRYLHAIYEARPDLQNAFPNLAGKDGPLYLEWIRQDGVIQHDIPASLLPKLSEGSAGGGLAYAPPSRLTDGVNIAGYFRAEVGVGEAARLLTTAIEASATPHSTLTYDATLSRKAHPFLERGDGSAPHDINIVCVNADQIARFARDAGPAFFEGRHTAGYWFWELGRFPPAMHDAFDYVDEVWAATDFMASAFRSVGRRPVHTVPLPIPIPVCSPAVTRSSLRLPPGFMFLFAFDFFSIPERKNPVGLIDAFQQAFQPGEGPILVIKTINGDARIGDLERVRAATAARPDIIVIDEYYSAEEKNSILGLCDCYVSLHRSEGLGLTIAEAMGLQKPVIATAYSGNLDFMTAKNSYLVDYVMAEVPQGCEPYPEGTPWAEPNISHAAELMRRVYEARDEAARKAATARQDILTKHNADAAGLILKRRLDDIRRTNRPSEATSIPSDAATTIALNQTRPETPVLASLDRIDALLTPMPSVAPGRRFQRPLLVAQELLFRVLRPYWWQQRQAQSALVGVVREAVQSAARAERSERQQRQAIEALWVAVHALDRSRQDKK